MLEVRQPRSPQDSGWTVFHEMLSRAARQMHFDAFALGAVNRPALLKTSRDLAEMALSIHAGRAANSAGDPEDLTHPFPPDYRPPLELKG
jgi:hypothetical protein